MGVSIIDKKGQIKVISAFFILLVMVLIVIAANETFMTLKYSKEKKLVFTNIKVWTDSKLYENPTEEIFAINISKIKIEFTIKNIKTTQNIENISLEYFIRKSKFTRELKEIDSGFDLIPLEEKKFGLDFSVPEEVNKNVSSIKFYLRGVGEDNFIYTDKYSIRLEFDERVYRDYLDRLEQERLKEVGPQLVTKIGNKKLPDDEWTKKYMKRYNNFSDINFVDIQNKTNFILKNRMGNIPLKGLTIGKKKYAIHVTYCSLGKGACAFRINGIPIKYLYDPKRGNPSTFDLEDNYRLKINSIEFDHCLCSPCDPGLCGIDIVDISIEKKGEN